jgi:hypothetical protein
MSGMWCEGTSGRFDQVAAREPVTDPSYRATFGCRSQAITPHIRGYAAPSITGNDRYPFPASIQTLRAILAKLRPEPIREPLPPPKVYAPPRATAGRRRP